MFSKVRLASPGEFTLRAYLNNKKDLSQAEAVSDLIASESKEAHRVAMHQMRGGYSNEIEELREKLIDFKSLIELELEKKNQSIIQLKNKINDKYNQKIPINLVVSDSKDILLYKIERIQKSIDKIGPINMEVQEQYGQDKNRLKLLKDQKEDLIVSEKNILKTIDKVDKIARNQFIKTLMILRTYLNLITQDRCNILR